MTKIPSSNTHIDNYTPLLSFAFAPSPCLGLLIRSHQFSFRFSRESNTTNTTKPFVFFRLSLSLSLNSAERSVLSLSFFSVRYILISLSREKFRRNIPFLIILFCEQLSNWINFSLEILVIFDLVFVSPCVFFFFWILFLNIITY